MIITDEMVETACVAYQPSEDDWHKNRMRAALEAVAPMLRAQGMRKMANLLHSIDDSKAMTSAIDRAIAQELDPK